MYSLAKRSVWVVALFLVVGCAHQPWWGHDNLAQRIQPPPGFDESLRIDPPPPSSDGKIQDKPKPETNEQLPDPKELPRNDKSDSAPTLFGELRQASCQVPDRGLEGDPTIGKPLSLSEAIELAFRLQPRLRVFLEGIEQARGAKQVALAPFLPNVSGGYSVGDFDLSAGGSLPNGFSFLPIAGTIPFGLEIRSTYELAEFKLQWILCDFGRRLGKFNQAELAAEIARLQTDRAYQTVANEVSLAYFQVLRAQSLRRTAQEAVRRTEDDLDVAKKLAKGGVIEQEKVLRAEVLLAQAQKVLDSAEAAEGIAVAALNLAIGLNVNCPTTVAEAADVPPLPGPLAACLATAASRRRELDVARRSIRVAQEGTKVTLADFAPRVIGGVDLLDFQQGDPRARADISLGFIKLEWGLFEGGRRVGELRIQDSKIRSAVAEADSVADNISFQVTEAYRLLVTARKGIDRSRPAVEQATENHRLVLARYKTGDAAPTEITDAETSLTRAQQDYLNSLYDYHSALVRLEYAMGSTLTPSAGCGQKSK
jgi:outer membrane protein TolC